MDLSFVHLYIYATGFLLSHGNAFIESCSTAFRRKVRKREEESPLEKVRKIEVCIALNTL